MVHPAEASNFPAAGLLLLSVPALCDMLTLSPIFSRPCIIWPALYLPYVSHTEAGIWRWPDVHGEESLPVEGLLSVFPGHRSGDMTKGGGDS